MSLVEASAHPPSARYHLVMLDAETCASYLVWLLGEPQTAAPDETTGLAWALAHCDDGVTWGRYDEDEHTWYFGNQAYPVPNQSPAPQIRRDRLQELRIFGDLGEVLIWKTTDGFRGRFLHELDPPADREDTNDPLRPSDEERILLGNRIIAVCAFGFTHVCDGAGKEQVVPLSVTNEVLQTRQMCLSVRHYYEMDTGTGAVRIAVTRLVNLKLGNRHGA